MSHSARNPEGPPIQPWHDVALRACGVLEPVVPGETMVWVARWNLPIVRQAVEPALPSGLERAGKPSLIEVAGDVSPDEIERMRQRRAT